MKITYEIPRTVEEYESLYDLVGKYADWREIMPHYPGRSEFAMYCHRFSWFYCVSCDGDFVGYLVVDSIREREACIHVFVMPGVSRAVLDLAFRGFCAEIFQRFDVLHAYIRENRRALLNFARRYGFQFDQTICEGYRHGQQRRRSSDTSEDPGHNSAGDE